jgi:hypothetical protein
VSQDTAIPPARNPEAPPPRDYRIATPEGWERIVLDPTMWDPVIARIVDKEFKGVDNAPHLKAQMRDMLRAQAAGAVANGGLEMYLSLMRLANMPLPASLVVTFIAPREDGTPPPLSDLATAYAAQGQDVRMMDFPAGPALRRKWREEPRPAEQVGNTRPVAHLDIQFQVPGSTAFLLLSFSTPMFELAQAMDGLFESIASTLRWVR